MIEDSDNAAFDDVRVDFECDEAIVPAYIYDSLDRLEAARFGNGIKIDYEYDAAGNRLGKAVSSKVILTNLPDRVAAAANQGSADKTVFAFRATVSEDEDTTFTRLILEQATSLTGMTVFSQARLVEDTNANGVQDGGEPVVSTILAPPIGDGILTFSGFIRLIPANTAVDYLVLADIAPAAPVGETVTLALEDEAGATARFGGVESGALIYPLGPPFSSPAVTILLDNTAPAFAGLNPISPGGPTAHLTWPAATDPAMPITYRIWQSTNASFVPSGPPDFTTAELEHYVTGLPLGTPYYFIARAVDAAGNEDSNTVRRDFTPTDPDPPVFAGLESATPLYDGSGKIRLRWFPAADWNGPVTYTIYMDTSPLFTPPGGLAPIPGIADALPEIIYDVPGLPLGVAHTFIVRAEDALGQEETNLVRRTATPTSTVDTTPPSFAGLVQALPDPAGTGDILLSWNAAADSQGTLPITYTIFWDTVSGPAKFALDRLTTTTLSQPVRGLPIGVPHYFSVRAEDAAGNRETNTVERMAIPTLQASPAIEFAGLISAEATTDGSGKATLRWDSAVSIHPPLAYDVYKGAAAQNVFGLPVFVTTGDFGLGVAGLPIGTAARFGVRARDGAGRTDANAIMIEVTPTDVVAPAFAGLAGAGGTPTGVTATITLNWAAATDYSEPVEYLVYESTTQGTPPGAGTLVATVTGTTTHQLTGRNQGQDYFYVVRARDAQGNVDSNTVEWGVNVDILSGVRVWEVYE